MNPNRSMRATVSALVIVGLLPSTFIPAHAFTGGITTVYSTPAPDRVERARTFAAKTPELDQTYQRTMRAAASKVAVASALRRALRGFVEKLPVIGAIAVLASDLYGIWVKRDDNTNDLQIPSSEACSVAPCFEYRVSLYSSPGSWSASPSSAFNSSKATLPSGLCGSNCSWQMNIRQCTASRCDFNFVSQQRNPNDGTVETTTTPDSVSVSARPVGVTEADPNGPKRSVTDAELEDLLKADKPFIPILKQMDDLGKPVEFPNPEVEDMPKPIVIQPTTVVKPDGSKTITQTTLEPYRDPADESIKWKRKDAVTEISKPDANGNTTTKTETTTTDKGESSTPEKAPEAPATDSRLPEQPKLYKQRYPQGITGVWQTQRDALANSPLFTIAKSLMPAVGLGGSCPTMPVNLNFSNWANFGVKDVAPPCQVWDWGKAICIVSACLLARRLIFGG